MTRLPRVAESCRLQSIPLVVCVVSVVGVVLAVGRAPAQAQPSITAHIGPTRLLSPNFGYSVVSRTVDTNDKPRTSVALFVYDHGHWRNATPQGLRAESIDDVDFIDARHGWLAAYNCATVRVSLYRTSDGGRTWTSLGPKGEHSCGGGPTWVSFVDQTHGWMEPVSPNGPAGILLRTRNGGATWSRVAGLYENLPCLAPISFVSRSTGWIGRCDGHLYKTIDGGRRWKPVALTIRTSLHVRELDVPRFFAGFGIEAATLGDAVPANRTSLREHEVTFSVSTDRGRNWVGRATRPLTPCTQSGGVFYPRAWPAAIASADVWWVVSTGLKPVVQITTDSGRSWRTVAARGLPRRSCSVTGISAANANVAWLIAHASATQDMLFETRDDGQTWHRVRLLR